MGRRAALAAAAWTIALACGCQGGRSEILTVPAPCRPSGGAPLLARGEAEGEAQLSFYRDVLPILSANTAGRSYKCTVCHAHYATHEGVASVDEIERIVASVEEGRMPRGGDPVKDEDIRVLKAWRLQGLQVGSGDDSDSGSGSGSSSGASVGMGAGAASGTGTGSGTDGCA